MFGTCGVPDPLGRFLSTSSSITPPSSARVRLDSAHAVGIRAGGQVTRPNRFDRAFHGLETHESMANGIGTATTGSPDWAGRAAKPQRIGGWGTEQHVVGTAMRASEFVWAR